MSTAQWEKLTDDQLVEHINKGGNTRAFDVLYKRYKSKVLDKCFSFVKNRDRALELTEDIFSKTFEKMPGFKFKSSFSSWLYSITYNHCIDYLREKKKIHYPQWDSENEIPEIIDETDESLVNISYENLMSVMELIHPEEKALLLMKYQDDLSIKDISTALRITENATKMRLKRARTRVLYVYMQKFSVDI